MATRILLVRHAQSQGNIAEAFVGHTDIPLSPLGEKQAKMLTEYLKDQKIDAIYSSDLSRAVETIKDIAQTHNLTINTNQALREVYAGDWENVMLSIIFKDYPKEAEDWISNAPNTQIPNGEKISELATRVVNAVNEIAKQNDGKTILIASHANSIRAFESIILEGSLQDGWYKINYVSNASVSIYDYNNGKYSLVKRNIDDFMGEHITRLKEEFKKR